MKPAFVPWFSCLSRVRRAGTLTRVRLREGREGKRHRSGEPALALRICTRSAQRRPLTERGKTVEGLIPLLRKRR